MNTHYPIIDKLAQDRFVEKMIGRLTRKPRLSQNLKDLSQDIYLNLLTKDSAYICELHKNNELEKYIIGIIKKNIYSYTSQYFRSYAKWDKVTTPIDPIMQLGKENILYANNNFTTFRLA